MGRGLGGGFSELAGSLGWTSEEVIATLVAYFDETGHSEDPNVAVVGVAGAIAPLESWVRLECDWAKITAAFGVREVHMKHLAHFTGEFSGWTEERRRDLLGALFGVMDRDISEYVGAMMALETAWRSRAQDDRRKLGDPYHGCAITCLGSCASYAALEPDRRVKLVFAWQPEFSGFAQYVYDEYKDTQPNGDRLGSFVVEPLRLPQLQVGDIVAYELGRSLTDRVRGIQRRRWPLDQIVKKGTRYLKIKRTRTEVERL